MTSPRTRPIDVIRQFQNLLREGYRSGFPILKELLQNADDAGAGRLLLFAHPGLPGSVNPLLQAPALLVANDGAVLGEHFDAMLNASGGSKGGDANTVGRFGLGQKAVYHLCDAFIARAFLEDQGLVRRDVVNPWEEIEGADAAGGLWKTINGADARLLDELLAREGLDEGGMALWLPLRSEALSPGDGLSLVPTRWSLESALEDLLNSPILPAALACLRSLEAIDVVPADGLRRRIVIAPDAGRLSKATVGGEGRRLGGKLREGANATATFLGREIWARDGRAPALKTEEDWPKSWNVRHEAVLTEAEPHGAVLLCRSAGQRGEGELRLHWTVYLPVGNAVEIMPLPSSLGAIDLMLHGYFFVSSDRTTIAGLGDEQSIEARWNRALQDEATLPLVLDVLADALPTFSDNNERYALLGALSRTNWWSTFGPLVCDDRAIALSWAGQGRELWQLARAASLRPVPLTEATTVKRLAAAWPHLAEWCAKSGVRLALGSILAADKPQWRDHELAAMVRMAGAAAFTKNQVAETLATLLEASGAVAGLDVAQALAETYRAAARTNGTTSFAREPQMRRLVQFMQHELLLPLPPSVEHRGLLAALVGATLMIPVRAVWHEAEPRLNSSDAIALLDAAAPFLGNRPVAREARAVINRILELGSLTDLLRDPRAQQLKIIPATRVLDKKEEVLSLASAQVLAQQGLLFQPMPNPKWLDMLAGAVIEPAIYRLNAADEGSAFSLAKTTEDHLERVVRAASRFGDAAERVKLVELLHETADRFHLRRLVAGRAEFSTSTNLIEMGKLSDVLASLAAKTGQHGLIIEEEFASLRKSAKERIGIQEIDAEELGRWLVIAQRNGSLPPISDAQAMALLRSGLENVVLSALPLHRITDRTLVAADDRVWLERAENVPDSLRPFSRLVDLWPDNAVQRVQRDLLRPWDANAQIETALNSPDPAQHVSAIAQALARPDADLEAFATLLKVTRWIRVGDIAVNAGAVLDLPSKVGAALRALIGQSEAYLDVGQLPTVLRDQHLLGVLHEHGVLSNRAESLGLAAMLAGEAGAVALGLHLNLCADDLRTLARQQVDLNASGWPLISAALVEDVHSDSLVEMADHLVAPDDAALVTQLNALATTAESARANEAARRLHLLMFQRHAKRLAPAGYLPASLLLQDGTGAFQRADALVRSARVAVRHILATEYEAALPPRQSELSLVVEADKAVPPRAEDFAIALGRHLEFWRDCLPEGGAHFLMALLGRDSAMQAQAADWRGSRTFAQICEAVDASLPDEGALRRRLCKVRFRLAGVADGEVRVSSAAGTQITVTLVSDTATWFIDTHRCAPAVAGGEPSADVELIFSDYIPADEKQVPGLLRDLVRGLLGPLHLQFNDRGAGVLEQLETLFQHDRVTVEDTREELREVIHERLRGLKLDGSIKVALAAYHDASRGQRRAASEALWEIVQLPETAPALLKAVRKKIFEMGYADGRALFELFQNADDALAYMPRDGQGHFRVEAQRGTSRTIDHLSVVHWGRPINTPGNGREIAPGYRRDLANMLAIGHSEKDDDHQTGRFGLGFKTVHMLCDSPGIASGPRLAARIGGGLVPVDWPEGPGVARRHASAAKPATVIDLPIAPAHADAAGRAWEAFRRAAPWLVAIAPSIGSIALDDGEPVTHNVFVEELANGVELITLTPSGLRAFRLTLNEGFRLFLPFGVHGPYALPANVRQFWRLVPLDGIDRHGAWLMEGRFDVDPGRTQFSGSAEEVQRHFTSLGSQLGQLLVSLFDAVDGDWPAFAAREGLDASSQQAFWIKLVDLFAIDLRDGLPERGLHLDGGGLSHLLRERPVVGLALGGFARAEDVAWQLSGAMSEDQELLEKVAHWPALAELKPCVVTPQQADRLVGLGLGHIVPKLDLAVLLERMTPDRIISPKLGETLGAVIDSATLQTIPWEEQVRLRQYLRECLFLAEDGSHHQIRLLGFLQSEAEDVAFAPASGRLSASYQGMALAFATAAREQAGGVDDVRRRWAATADGSPARMMALIQCIASADGGRARMLADAAAWLPRGQALVDYTLLEQLDPQLRARLLATLGVVMTASTGPVEDGEAEERAWYQPNPELAFELVAEWWDENGESVSASYANATYPDGFSPLALKESDDERWFTMLALATFHTIGRIQPEASRNFVAEAIREGWWRDLATIRHDDDLKPFTDRLRAWSEPWDAPRYGQWRRCLVDLCMVARYVDRYRRLFRSLPGAVEQGKVSLRTYLTPSISPHAAEMALDAAAIAPSLGIGANWLIRELCRYGVYSPEQAAIMAPYGWATTERVRRLFGHFGAGVMGHGIDHGRELHAKVSSYLDVDGANFGGAGDLPLHVLTIREHREALQSIIDQSSARPWEAYDYDDDN